jgi:hypothetical protein
VARFGGDPKAPNFLPIMPGSNHTVRMHRPGEALLTGAWTLPVALPAR